MCVTCRSGKFSITAAFQHIYKEKQNSNHVCKVGQGVYYSVHYDIGSRLYTRAQATAEFSTKYFTVVKVSRALRPCVCILQRSLCKRKIVRNAAGILLSFRSPLDNWGCHVCTIKWCVCVCVLTIDRSRIQSLKPEPIASLCHPVLFAIQYKRIHMYLFVHNLVGWRLLMTLWNTYDSISS